MAINSKINKVLSKKSKDNIYVIYYYPPYITLTIDKDIIRFFGWSKDIWTIIDENGQEYEINAILLFYGLPIKKDDLKKLKDLKKDNLLETYYGLSLIDLYTGLTNFNKKDVKKLTEKLTSIKGKPIKVKEMEDLKLNKKDSIERAYAYHLKIRELNAIYGKVISYKKGIFFKGIKFSLPSFSAEGLRKFVYISIIVVILLIFGSTLYFIYKGFGVVNTFQQTFTQTYLSAYNQTFNITNPIR